MTLQPNSQNLYQTFLSRTMRQMGPVVLFPVILFIVLSLIGMTITLLSGLVDGHENTVTLVATQLRDEIANPVEDLFSLSNQTAIRRPSDPQQTLDVLRSLIQTHRNEYFGVRFINTDNEIRHQIVNVDGIALNLNSGSISDVLTADEQQALASALQAQRPQVFVGDFRLRKDEQGRVLNPPQSYYTLIVPVFSQSNTGSTIGALHLDVNAAPLIGILTELETHLRNPTANRHLVLITDKRFVAGDSNAANTFYLQNIENPATNIGDDPLYSQLSTFGADNPEDTFFSFTGSMFISKHAVEISESAGLQWQLFLADDALVILSVFVRNAVLLIALGVVAGFVAIRWTHRALNPLVKPVATATALAQELAAGPAASTLPVADKDGELIGAMSHVSRRLSNLDNTLNTEVNRNRRNLQVATRIGREIATLYDIDTLLKRSINLICNELGHYHAQVFLVDDAGANALLVHSRGEIGQKMLEQRHTLGVGSNTIIGTVTRSAAPVVINDTAVQGSIPFGFNPLLPETQAELGLPLIIGQKVIGALDIQSKTAHAFLQDDIPVYQLIADQLAIAIEHARLVNESEQRYEQINKLNRQLTGEAWEAVEDELGLNKNYNYNLLAVQQDEGNGNNQSGVLSAPIQIRGETIGTLNADLPSGQAYTEGDEMVMRSVAERVALAIENRRLFMQAEVERRNLDAVMSTMPVGVIVLDPQTFMPIQFNERASELLGRPVDLLNTFTAEAYNLYRTGTNLLYPNDELPIRTALETGGQIFSDDVAVIKEDVQTDLLMNASPIRDSRGIVNRLLVTLQDISNLRNLENTLQENLRETVALYEAQRSLSEADTLEDVKDVIIVQVALLQPTDGYLLLVDSETDVLRMERQLFQPLEEVDPLLAVLTGKDVITSTDVATDAKIPYQAQMSLPNMGIRSLMAIPLSTRSREEPLGWLVAVDSLPDNFTLDQERMLTTIADMASIAVDNRYLFERTEAALRGTNALYNATTTISRARDVEELAAALRTALSDLKPDLMAAYIFGEMGSPVELFGEGLVGEDSILDVSKLLTYDLSEDEGVFISDLAQRSQGPIERELLKTGFIQAFAAVNLRVKDVSSGRLFIGYHTPREFTASETRFLNSIATSASVVIDNNILFEQIQSTLQETSVLYQASRALTQASTPEEIIEVVVNYLIEPHVNHVFMALLTSKHWDSSSATVQIDANWHSSGGVNLQGVTLSADQFPAWKQLAADTVLTIDDIYDDDNGLDIMERTGIESLDARSVVIIPLRVAQRAIGAIWIGSQEPYHYSDRDLRVFQSFSEQASLSLEAAHLVQQTEHRARQLETSAVVGRRASETLDLNVLLPQIVDLIRDQFGYDHVQVFLMDDYDEYATLRASTGEAGKQLLSIKHKLKKGSESVIGRVTSAGEPTIALDTADANVVHQPNPYLPLTRSEMALPLIAKGQVVGALDVQSNQPNAFNEEDVRALGTLAAQISIAIDNARLYEDAERRAKDMSFLFDITTVAASADTVNASLQSVAERLKESLRARAVTIYLPQLYIDHLNNTFKMMRAVASIGTDHILNDIPEIKLGDSENIIGIVSSTHQPAVIPDTRREIRYTAIAPNALSAIITPIMSGQNLVGAIAMESERGNAFGTDTQQLLLTLAGSLSAIIQNATLVEQLQTTNDQLREIDRLKSEFLANMSHELRTPLNSIIGFSRVMLKGIDGPLTEMQEQDLSTIYNSGQHLLTLINDLLDQAKIAANKMELKLAHFDVKPMVESVKSIAIGLVKEKPIDLIVEIAPNLPKAYGDEFRTRQILLNLVNNAAKFTPEGSITVRTYLTHHESIDSDMIRIDVTDTGIGIAEKDMPLLFEAFRQIDSSLTRTVGGTGLGLPIARSLAEMQGGTLTVTSEINAGSTFSVFIPLQPSEEEEKHEETPTQPRPVVTTLEDTSITKTSIPIPKGQLQALMPKQRLVLLIEDNKDMVDQFRRALQREGFDVQTADHPAYAEAMVSNLRPTLLLMDVNFAEGRGWEILQKLKDRDDTFDIPIVIVTLSDESERAYQLGAYAFIQRPFMPEELVEVVLEAEKESRRNRILIIDDDMESIRLITQLLEEHGQYRVFAAQNAAEGISLVARRQPDLIILDLRMPGKDGFAVLQELRANPETANIPVFIITGDKNLNEGERASLKNVKVLEKTDFSQDDYQSLIETVESHLN